MSTVGQRSLNSFYQSVQFENPFLAAEIREDVETVAIHALGADKSGGQEAAERLRRKAFDMPVLFQRVLEGALQDLGYDV